MNIMLDSGAFSAWSKGAKIDIDDYIQYCLDNQHGCDYIVNLDVIPASPGVKNISKEEIERSAQAGYNNYRKMVNAGIDRDKLIHVFHQNEDFKWLKRMVRSMHYIGLSPANDRTTREKILWLDDCMKYVTDDEGMPLVKFHGFAVTSHRIMKRYPWYSVDSSTWAMTGGRGVMYIPIQRDGEWDFSQEPTKVSLSQVTNKKDHFDYLPAELKRRVAQYLEENDFVIGKSSYKGVKEGYKLKENEKFVPPRTIRNLSNPPKGDKLVEVIEEKGVINTYTDRFLINAIFLTKFQETLPEWPWAFKTRRKTLGF